MIVTIGTIIKGDFMMTGTKRIFYPHKYYVVTADNKVILEASTMSAARRQGLSETDTILIAVPAVVSNTQTKQTTIKVDKIIFNFDKKLLTVDGDSVTLDGVEYMKGETELDDSDLKDWSKMLADARKCCTSVEIVGIPPIDGKDITNEMSDL